MKPNYILQTLVLLFVVFTANAQRGINYKAIIKDGEGAAIANTEVTVQFTILENGTTEVYKETHAPTTDANGIVIVNIGEGTVVSGVFNDIDWGSNPHFLNTKINTGSGLTDMGTTEFKTVPYALYAKDGPGARELNDLSDAKSLNGSVYIGPLTGMWDNENISGNTSNVTIGAGAGLENQGTGNIFLGFMAGQNETGSNKLYINNSSGKPLIYGDFESKKVTVNGDLEVAEKVKTPDAGNADMKAYIYGMVTKTGNKISSASSDGFTVRKHTQGIYEILFTGLHKPIGTNSYIVLATAEMEVAGDYNFPAVSKITNGFWVFVKNVEKDYHTDSQFSFVVYKK